MSIFTGAAHMSAFLGGSSSSEDESPETPPPPPMSRHEALAAFDKSIQKSVNFRIKARKRAQPDFERIDSVDERELDEDQMLAGVSKKKKTVRIADQKNKSAADEQVKSPQVKTDVAASSVGEGEKEEEQNGEEADEEEDEESEETPKKKRKKQILKCNRVFQVVNIALPHVVLISVTLIYLVSGALLFQLFEADAEAATVKRKVDGLLKRYDEVINETWKMRSTVGMTPSIWLDNVRASLRSISDLHESNFSSDLDSLPHLVTKWTFPTALLNALTLVSACGYNKVGTFSEDGQLVSVVYTMLGIPLMFVTAANIGKFLSELIETTMRYFSMFAKCFIRFSYRYLPCCGRCQRSATTAEARQRALAAANAAFNRFGGLNVEVKAKESRSIKA